MPVFQYSARNAQGQMERGLAHGESLDQVVGQLSRKGLQVQEIGAAPSTYDPTNGPPVAPPTEARSVVLTEVIGPAVGGVPLSTQAFFFRQLAAMLKAGVNPAQSLDTLGNSASHPKLRTVIHECRDQVVHGRPMSVGMQRYPEVFSPLTINMIRVAEVGGFLDEQCATIADYLTRDVELRNTIRRETAYPKIVLGFSIILILGVNAIITAISVRAQTIPVPWLLWIFVAFCALAWFVWTRYALRRPEIKARWDQIIRAIPGIGSINHGFAMAKYSRALAAMYRGGVGMPESAQLAADACGNEDVRQRVYPASQALQEGHGIADSLAATGAFSPLVLDMTRTGETTGEMDMTLEKVAEFYEDEGVTKAKIGAKIFGVICFVIVAIYVLFVILSFYQGYAGAALSV